MNNSYGGGAAEWKMWGGYMMEEWTCIIWQSGSFWRSHEVRHTEIKIRKHRNLYYTQLLFPIEVKVPESSIRNINRNNHNTRNNTEIVCLLRRSFFNYRKKSTVVPTPLFWMLLLLSKLEGVSTSSENNLKKKKR